MQDSSYCFGEVYRAFCMDIDTPVALSCWLLFKHGEHRQLAEKKISPRSYTSARSFHRDYTAVSFASKSLDLHTDIDTRKEALLRFTTSEVDCKNANKLFKQCRSGISSDIPAAVLFTAKRKIASLLGEFEHSKVLAGMGFGPGATNDLTRKSCQPDTKLTKVPLSVSYNALRFAQTVIGDDLHWSSCILNVPVDDIVGPFCFIKEVFNITNYGTIDTVPKNALTDRVILKEPRLNAFLQKGVGAYLRRKLKSVGIFLDSQEHNQRAASRCFSDMLATLDLKAASDSICREFVFELLPVEWALYLDAIRSKYAKLPDGSEVYLEKFSSMGNGFTFELETLLFWAVSKAVSELLGDHSEVLVYGDDIVCSSDNAPAIVEILTKCGFSINLEKSYISGSFFESCGKHYFEGHDVTPIYQKEHFQSWASHVRLYNRLYRFSQRGFELRRAIGYMWRTRPPRLADCIIPDTEVSDDAYLQPWYSFNPVRTCENRGIQCKTIRLRYRSFPADDRAFLAIRLRASAFGLVYPNVEALLKDTSLDVPEPFNGFVKVLIEEPRAAIGTRWVAWV